MYQHETGKITEYLYHIDTRQFSINRITSVYCYWDGKIALLFDVGTSENVRHVMRVMKRTLKIPLEKLQAIIPTHYHFDHGGGALDLWRKMQKYNPTFQIYTTPETKRLLLHAKDHLKGAKTTFGEFVGTMDPLTDSEAERAFHIIQVNDNLSFDFPAGIQLQIIPTPGHTHDHKSLVLSKNNHNSFVFAGEALGTYFGDPEGQSLPSSMPPNFKYAAYMRTLNFLRELDPHNLGVCHFGVLKGQEFIRKYINQHEAYMQTMFREIQAAFNQDPRTRSILTALRAQGLGVENRVGEYYVPYLHSPFFDNLFLAVTYAMMVDMGYRAPKYEQPAQ